MEKIYTIVGKVIEQFQELEENLALLIYFYFSKDNRGSSIQNNDEIKREALEYWSKANEATLGRNLNMITQLNVFEQENDLLVLSFLKDKRNYVVHSFFKENVFDTDINKEKHKQELFEIYEWCKLINKIVRITMFDLYK